MTMRVSWRRRDSVGNLGKYTAGEFVRCVARSGRDWLHCFQFMGATSLGSGRRGGHEDTRVLDAAPCILETLMDGWRKIIVFREKQ